MNRIVFLFSVVIILVSCQEDPVQREGFEMEKRQRNMDLEKSSEINKRFTKEDLDQIHRYINHPDRKWDMKESGTGLFYYIYEQHDSAHPEVGDVAVLEYQVSLLDGTVCYSSDKDGLATFVVEKEDVESGVHESVRLLGIGDEGIFIVHHSRAHGLLGDDDMIPPLQNVIYKLKLVDIR